MTVKKLTLDGAHHPINAEFWDNMLDISFHIWDKAFTKRVRNATEYRKGPIEITILNTTLWDSITVVGKVSAEPACPGEVKINVSGRIK